MREQIKAFLKEKMPEIDFEGSSSLVNDGILDSMLLVQMITDLSMEFNVMIPYEEIVPENFNSLDAIVKLVEKYQ